jgi:8-oxo-dGTP diphosphatase
MSANIAVHATPGRAGGKAPGRVPIMGTMPSSLSRYQGVLVACRRADGRWLLIRRGRAVSLGGKLCFPGGGLEPGESPAQAAVREMAEELGATVTPGPVVHRWDAGDYRLTLWCVRAELTGPALRPHPEEVAEVLWLTVEEALAERDLLAATRACFAALLPEPAA